MDFALFLFRKTPEQKKMKEWNGSAGRGCRSVLRVLLTFAGGLIAAPTKTASSEPEVVV